MTTPIDIIRISRSNILRMVEPLTLDQINKIPTGFTGNVAWHMGHLTVAAEGLLYRLTGNPGVLEQAHIDKYKKGSVPTAPITQAELDFIKKELVAQIDRLSADMGKGIFKNYTEYTTSFGNTIHSFDEALNFICTHEGLHNGYIMAMRRVVSTVPAH